MNFLQIPALNKLFVNFFNAINSNVLKVFPSENISYGLSIIILTIIIRLCLVPLYVKQMKSTAGMSKIGPEVKKLQKKYKNDPKKLQEETMNLYKEHGVNPFGGCLPLLLQMPILLALYNVFLTLKLSGISFLWIHDLAKHATISDPITFILPILSAATTYLSGVLMSMNADPEQAKQTKTMNIVMAGMLFWMSINFNAALVLYWVTGNIIQIIQTQVVMRLINASYDKKMGIDNPNKSEV